MLVYTFLSLVVTSEGVSVESDFQISPEIRTSIIWLPTISLQSIEMRPLLDIYGLSSKHLNFCLKP